MFRSAHLLLAVAAVAALLDFAAAVAPAEPLNALVLPRQPAGAASDEAAQPGASSEKSSRLMRYIARCEPCSNKRIGCAGLGSRRNLSSSSRPVADARLAVRAAPAAADATRDLYAAQLLSGDAAARNAPLLTAHFDYEGDDAAYEVSTTSTEDNQLVDAPSAWGDNSWGLGGLARQPGELPPRAGAAHFARYSQAAAVPWAARIGQWGLIKTAGSGADAAAGSDEPAEQVDALRVDVEATADFVQHSSSDGGDSSRIAKTVLAAMTPAAALLAAEPGVASVGVHVTVTQESSLQPQADGGGVKLAHDWHVSTATDVEVSDEAAAAAIAAMPSRLPQLGAMLREAAVTMPRGGRLDAQLLASRDIEARTARERQADAMSWYSAALMDPSSMLFAAPLPRSQPVGGSVLGETPSERAMGLAVLAIMWVFVVRASSVPCVTRPHNSMLFQHRACSSVARCTPRRTRRMMASMASAATSRRSTPATPRRASRRRHSRWRTRWRERTLHFLCSVNLAVLCTLGACWRPPAAAPRVAASPHSQTKPNR
jgi:hypothetical protein